MSLVLDVQYAGMLNSYVRNFHKKGSFTYQMSCPICGDSTKVKTKARGYLYKGKDCLIYKCHNCDITTNMRGLLKQIDGNLSDQYIFDAFNIWKADNPIVKQESELDFAPPVFQKSIPDTLVKISSLATTHKAKKYVESRGIPSPIHYQLYYTPTFKKWSNSIVPDTYDSIEFDEPRLIIPLIDQYQNITGYQGRSLQPNSKLKYITLLLSPSNSKLYGLDRVDLNKTVYVLEGPIDAMFISNGIATTGGRMDTLLPSVGVSKDRAIIIYDNEPRNIHTIRKMEKAIAAHYRVCIWPKYITQSDINSMILDGNYDSNRLVDIINQNSYSGLLAEIQLSDWRAVTDV